MTLINWLKKLTTTPKSKIEDKAPNHGKYITTLEWNNSTKEIFDERFKQANLRSKTDIDDFIKKKVFWWETNGKVTSNKVRHFEAENELNDHVIM